MHAGRSPAPRPLRAALAAAAVAFALYAAFCGPVLRHFSSSIPFGLYAKDSEPLELVQGDHLQLLYHFDLFDAYLHDDLPWFRNLWEFNTSDDARPRHFDPCYAPFALPYSLLRRAGATDAAAWNACQALSVFLGVLFCAALARRFGAGRAGAFAVAALATCVPYRWVVLAGGSPTGFGMGILPAVALGADMAVRDRSLRGGALCALALAACYATDLHCYLFSALALPFWCALGLVRSESNPFAPRRRLRRLALALSPVAAAGVATVVLGAWAKRAYASTDVSSGRTLVEIRVHSPDWHAFFDPFYFSHSPEQFHMGALLPALLAAAGVVLVAAGVLALLRALRPSRKPAFASPAIVFHPAFSSRPDAPARPIDAAARAELRRVIAALALAAAILFVFLLALGVNGPAEGLPLRLVRKLVPPFRMVRQPLKAFCLLPAFYSAFFAAGLSALAYLRRPARRAAPEGAGLSRLAAAKAESGAAALARMARERRALRLRSAAAAAACVAVPLAAYLSVSRGMHPGLCRLPGPNKAYALAVEDAKARGFATPRAIALPIWPGDSSWSSLYQYPAARAGMRMLNGYAAVTEKRYVERVFLEFETMTEGELTPRQLRKLLHTGVSTVILHENAFPPKVSPFPFGATLRRLLADPHLRLLGEDGGAWAFAIDYDAPGASSADVAPFAEPAFHAPVVRSDVWPPAETARLAVRSRPAFRKGRFGWLVRAEAGRDLSVATEVKVATGTYAATGAPTVFPAVPGGAPHRLAWIPVGPEGGDLKTRVGTYGPALTTHLAYTAATNFTVPPRADGSLFLPAPDLEHWAGTTVLSGTEETPQRLREPAALRFERGRFTAGEVLAGPSLPLPQGPGRFRARLETGDGAAAGGESAPGEPAIWISALEGAIHATPLPEGSPRPQQYEFDYDGTTPVRLRVDADPSRCPALLRGIAITRVP